MIARAAAGFVSVLAVVALSACRERDLPVDARASTSTGSARAAPPTSRIVYPSGPGSFVDLVASARHGVVAIRSATPVKSGPAAMFPGALDSVADVALGTGFLIEANGVFVLTTDHIAAATEELHVVLPDGTEVPARLVGRDVRLDLALLSIETPRLQPLRLGNSDSLQVGEWLVVLGDPFGEEVTASAGIVASTGRNAAASLLLGRAMSYRMLIQTDARIHRGNSGGPVLDASGQVIGVAVATGDHLTEMSYVIPINRAREVFDALRDEGKVTRTTWLGVLVKPVTTELATSLGLPTATGALVTEVKPGSPAARSAIRAGDVIVKWGERAVDHQSLPWIVAATPAGKPITVIVWRDRAEMQLAVVTERMPE